MSSSDRRKAQKYVQYTDTKKVRVCLTISQISPNNLLEGICPCLYHLKRRCCPFGKAINTTFSVPSAEIASEISRFSLCPCANIFLDSLLPSNSCVTFDTTHILCHNHPWQHCQISQAEAWDGIPAIAHHAYGDDRCKTATAPHTSSSLPGTSISSWLLSDHHCRQRL